MNSLDDETYKKLAPYNLLQKLSDFYKTISLEDLKPHKNSIIVPLFFK